jgi:isoleucyl-tRNA synthetase
MKQLAAAIQELDQEQIALFEKERRYSFSIEGQPAEVTVDDVEIISEDIPGWLVANEGRITVALDVTITDELKREGIARELVNRIQNLRKTNKLEITDKIEVAIEKNDAITPAVEAFRDYIAGQVLATDIRLVDRLPEGEKLDADDFEAIVLIKKL